MKDKKSIEFLFNLSNIRQSVGDYHLLTRAELRLLIKTPNIATKQRVELYTGLGSSPEYLTTRFITTNLKDKWLSFDVTETLQNWLKGNGGYQLTTAGWWWWSWSSTNPIFFSLNRDRAGFPALGLLWLQQRPKYGKHVQVFYLWGLFWEGRHTDAWGVDEATTIYPDHVHSSKRQQPHHLPQKTGHRWESRYMYYVRNTIIFPILYIYMYTHIYTVPPSSASPMILETPPSPHPISLSFPAQPDGDLLCAKLVHQFPERPGLEVDTRTDGLPRQLLHGLLHLHLERRKQIFSGVVPCLKCWIQSQYASSF